MTQGSRRRGRILIYVALILILGVVLVYFATKLPISGLSLTGEPTTAPVAETVPIVITTQPVGVGNVFTENVLTTIPYPKEKFIVGTFFTNVKDVVGKRAKMNLDAQIPVTSTMIAEDVGGSATAFQIPKGMVAVSIPIDRLSSVSYAVRPGDHVNVIVTALLVDLDQDFQTRLPNRTASVTSPGPCPGVCPSALAAVIASGGEGSTAGRAELDPALSQPVYLVPSEPQRPRLVTQTLMQDIIVLQVGNTPSDTAPVSVQPTPVPSTQGETTTTTTTTGNEIPSIITLIVSPQDALTLNYLLATHTAADSTVGSSTGGAMLTLALRSAGDDGRVSTEAVTLQYLMEQYNIPLPAKQPYGLEPSVSQLTPAWINDKDNIIPNPQ